MRSLELKIERALILTGLLVWQAHTAWPQKSCGNLLLNFSPTPEVQLDPGSSWDLENSARKLYMASEVEVVVATSWSVTAEVQQQRVEWMRRWLKEEGVDPTAISFRTVMPKPGVAYTDIKIVHDGCNGRQYFPGQMSFVTLDRADGVSIRCRQDLAQTSEAIEFKELDPLTLQAEHNWPANAAGTGEHQPVVAMVEVWMPDSLIGRDVSVLFPLRQAGDDERRFEIMRPTEAGLAPVRERIRVKKSGGVTMASVKFNGSGVFAIVSAEQPVKSEEDQRPFRLLAPEGWVFEALAWRSERQLERSRLDEGLVSVEVERRLMRGDHEVQIALVSTDGQKWNSGWMQWADLPRHALLSFDGISMHQLDPVLFSIASTDQP